MTEIRIGDNIFRLRKQAKITQEELASFLNLTKASVSKWETGQSLPDLLLLPQIAAFFDVTVDQLIGYEPQLSEQQIRKIYQELSGDFVKLSFNEAIEKCRKLVKTYYACYPFLYQIGNLWLNHVSLAASPKQQEELLRDILQLYNRVLTGSRDAQLQADARIMKALILMMLGEAQEAARLLEPMTHPQRLQNQCGSLVIQVFQMLGQDQKARSTAQIQCYLHLQQLLDISVRLLELEQTDEKKGLETIRRLRQLIETWQLEKLMPNQTLKFFYQSAVFFCCHGRREEALTWLDAFVQGSMALCRDDLKLAGDDYFTLVEEWFEQSALGTAPPRSPRLIPENILQALKAPQLASLSDNPRFIFWIEQMEKILKRRSI